MLRPSHDFPGEMWLAEQGPAPPRPEKRVHAHPEHLRPRRSGQIGRRKDPDPPRGGPELPVPQATDSHHDQDQQQHHAGGDEAHPERGKGPLRDLAKHLPRVQQEPRERTIRGPRRLVAPFRRQRHEPGRCRHGQAPAGRPAEPGGRARGRPDTRAGVAKGHARAGRARERPSRPDGERSPGRGHLIPHKDIGIAEPCHPGAGSFRGFCGESARNSPVRLRLMLSGSAPDDALHSST